MECASTFQKYMNVRKCLYTIILFVSLTIIHVEGRKETLFDKEKGQRM